MLFFIFSFIIAASLQVPADHKWIKLNKDQVGYYRVNYPVEQWKTLSEVLVKEPNVFSVADRSNLLNDAFSLAEATQLSYDIALDLTQYLEKETEYVPWSVAVSKLSVIRRLLYYTKHYPKFLVSKDLNILNSLYCYFIVLFSVEICPKSRRFGLQESWMDCG